MKSKTKQSKTFKETFDDKTSLIPEIIAENVCSELTFHFCAKGHTIDLSHHEQALVEKTYIVSEANGRFYKRCKSNSGRDYLYAFMRHWLSGFVKDENESLFNSIPHGFRNGVEV